MMKSNYISTSISKKKADLPSDSKVENLKGMIDELMVLLNLSVNEINAFLLVSDRHDDSTNAGELYSHLFRELGLPNAPCQALIVKPDQFLSKSIRFSQVFFATSSKVCVIFENDALIEVCLFCTEEIKGQPSN